MSRLLLISNRLPVQVRRVGRKPVVTPSAGGLVAGLLPAHERGDGLWLGTLGQDPTPAIKRELAARRLVPVSLPKELATRHYEGYSNQVLWPLCHYLTSRVRFDTRDFAAYESVNALFADAVAEVARLDDTIWIHDYHLMLLPGMLRKRLPQARIGFFLHIPFPSSEVFRVLPRKRRILEGLLGANLIGLHTYDYARHLATSFRRILGVEFDDDWFSEGAEERCKLGVFPLGVDVQAMDALARSPATERRFARITKQLQGRKLVLGVDRLDYTKGLVPRILAFRKLLEEHPEWQGKVTFLQLVVPSRDTIGSYNDLKRELERLIGETNGLYAREGLTPIQYMYRAVPPDELAAMYRAADVMFVTPVRDGMNLVCKEYVAARFDRRGSVVLSEFAGAASEMGEALLCNPWDIDGTAEILHQALVMAAQETERRMMALRRRNEANDVHRWVRRFLDTLEDVVRPPDPRFEPGTDVWQAECLLAHRKSQHALLALDYDGTLSDVASTPERAAPTSQLRGLLSRLGRLSRSELLLISGRDADTMLRWLGDLPVHLVAEHGYFMRLRGQTDWQVAARGADLSWTHAVRDVMEEYASRAPGVLIEEKRAALAWHYRLVEPAFGSWLARELAQHLAESFSQSPLTVHHGKKVVEVRPNGVDKGGAYKLVERRLGPFDFVFGAGDDKTDEDLFLAMPARAFSVKVGPGPTRARFRIESPAALRAFLEDLVRQSSLAPEQQPGDAR